MKKSDKARRIIAIWGLIVILMVVGLVFGGLIDTTSATDYENVVLESCTVHYRYTGSYIVRTGPDLNSDILCYIQSGQYYAYTGTSSSGWHKIWIAPYANSYHGTNGWVYPGSLIGTTTKTVVRAKTTLRVYKSPGSGGYGYIYAGQKFHYLSSSGDWFKIQMCGDTAGGGAKQGWVRSGSTREITVTSPNGGENWQRGKARAITWTSSNAGGYVKIELYKGGSYDRTITSSTSNDGSYSWSIPSTLATGTNYKIKITSTSYTDVSDMSNSYFTISKREITVTSPNGGENWQRGKARAITWTSSNAGGYVKIELYKGGSYDRTITSSTSNDGSYSWSIPSTLATGTNYKIKITSTSYTDVSDMSNSYFTISKVQTQVKGIDVSHWQHACLEWEGGKCIRRDCNDIDWSQVYNANYRFAFVKATQGDDREPQIKNPCFRTDMDKGKNAGVFMSAYHFACTVNDPTREANFFVGVSQDYLKSGFLRPVLDMETYSGCTNYCGTNTACWENVANWIDEWMSVVEARTGVKPILYVNCDYARHLKDSSITTKYDLWIAHYTTSSVPCSGEFEWDFWQYTNQGTVLGITANVVDLDLFNGDMSKLQTFVISGGDHIPPAVDALDVSPSSITLGDPFTILYSVSDDIDLAYVQLYRTKDDNGQPDENGWIKIVTHYVSGTSYSGSFTDSPSSTGIYWYGIHVGDTAGHWVTERDCNINPVKGTVKQEPDIGYAVLVAGDEEGILDRWAIRRDIEKAYQTLCSLGFDDERIFYLNSDSSHDADGDGDNDIDRPSSFKEFESAMGWARERVGEHSPFILYLVGHCDGKNFYLNDVDTISPSFRLDYWLGELPTGTRMLIIIDACYSGSFITPSNGEISAPNRVIITSAHDDQESPVVKGVGSFFSQELWLCSQQGKSVKDAFIEGTKAANDKAQHPWWKLALHGKSWQPWLDDNGDAVGNHPESLGVDGVLAATMIIGVPGASPSVGEGAPNPQLFKDCYDRNGGASKLGYPINKVHRWGNGYIQDFRGGEGYEGAIMQPDGVNCAYAVYGSIWSKYLILGGVEGPLEYPSTDESDLPSSSISSAKCRYNKFQGGAIVHHATGPKAGLTVFLGHGIFNKWGELNYGESALGLPTSDEREASQSGAEGFDTTGVVCNFEEGHIYWHSDKPGENLNDPYRGKAFETHGAIDGVYQNEGESSGWLGFPISDEYKDPKTGYARSDFEGGYITTPDGINYYAYHYNKPPSKPSKPSGPTTGEIGISYSYSTATTDPDNDNVYYWFDWGDVTNSGWIGPYSSGTSGSASKAWSNPDIYDVKAKAKDMHEAESSPLWSDSLSVCINGSWENDPSNPCKKRRMTCYGEYEYKNKPDGTPCDDGQYCTVNDACTAGVCSGSPRDCSALDDQCNVGFCDEDTDSCVKQPKQDGTDCGCTANNTLKRCYDGTCSDTGICNATICNADIACDGKKTGESCGTDRKCNSTCKCMKITNYGVDLTAVVLEKNTMPNVNATYTLIVKNTGTLVDSYTLSVDNLDNAAVATLSTYSITNLATGSTATVLLNVTAETNGIYRVSVTVISESDPVNATDYVNTTTTVTEQVPPVYPVYGWVYNSSGAPVPVGVTVFITDIDTTNYVTDETDNEGRYRSDIGAMALPGVAIGHKFIVNATYQGESGKCSFVFDPIANVSQQCDIYLVISVPVYGVNLTVEGAKTASKTTFPGTNATYTLTVKNTGNVLDNYTLLADNPDDAAIANLNTYSITNLVAGASTTVLLNVTDETVGTYNVGVTATSQGNSSVSDTIITKTTIIEILPPQIVTYTITNRTITSPQTTEIDVAFSEEVAWRIAIEGSSVVHDWTGTAKDPAPKMWDGTYEINGTVVQDGTYTVNVTGTNTTTGLSVINNTEFIKVTPTSTPNKVYLVPQHSSASFCNPSIVQIWVNGTDIAGAYINFTYDPACVNVTDVKTANFPRDWDWNTAISGREIIAGTTSDGLNRTGNYLFANLTIHCLSNDCITGLNFSEGSYLFDQQGVSRPATWTDGTFECRGICGDVNRVDNVNYGDVILLRNHLVHGFPVSDPWAADVNCQSDINYGDVILLRNHLVHGFPLNCC